MLNENRLTFEDVINRDGVLVYTNVGYSMMPLLRQRKDIIEIRQKPQGRCRKYDVILYKRHNKYILHRIIKVFPDGYKVLGDHNTWFDKTVTDDMIIGVMARVIRDGKRITTQNIWYKIYVHIWCDFYPIRFFMIKMKALIYKCLSFVKRRVFR